MKERLINNLGLKILSLFFAFIIWLMVVNISNPLVTRTKEVPLEVINGQVLTDAGLSYDVEGRSSVTVSYDVLTMNEYQIRATDFRAYIDLADMYSVTGSVPVTVEVLNNERLVNNVAARPSVIRVETEELQSKPFELVTSVVGSAAPGYALGSITLEPAEVTVVGPISQVGLISYMGVEIDITGLEDAQEGQVWPVYYDANGNELGELVLDDRVHTDADETGIHYRVSISKIKEVPLDFEVSGTVASGYRYTGVQCARQSVPVTGPNAALTELSMITIPGSVLDLDGATEDQIVTVDIRDYLPEGVQIAGLADTTAEVILKVEPLASRTLVLTEDDIRMENRSSDLIYELLPSSVEVVVQGLEEELDELQERDLGASLDLAGMSVGIHTGRLRFENSSVFTVLSQSGFQIQVSSRETGPGVTTAVPAESVSETPGETEGTETQAAQEENHESHGPEESQEAGGSPVPETADEESGSAGTE